MKGEGQGAVAEVALQYYDNSYNELLLSFANNVHTPEGGTHEEGFKLALTRVLNEYGRAKGILKDKDENLSGPDAREGIIAIISVKLQEAQFEGQTKAKLGYTFKPELLKHLNLSRLRVYATAKNFFTFSKIDNYDPDKPSPSWAAPCRKTCRRRKRASWPRKRSPA